MAKGVKFGKNTAKALRELTRRKPGYSLPGMDDRFREAPPDADTITIYNATGFDLNQYDVVELDGTINNQASLTLPDDMKNAQFNAVLPTDRYSSTNNEPIRVFSKRIVVVQDAIKKGELGQAKITGTTPVRISVLTGFPEPSFANVIPGNKSNLGSLWRNAQYGFPILWRESGSGTKWGVIDLKHFDGPSWYSVKDPVFGNLELPVSNRIQNVSNVSIWGGSKTFSDLWRNKNTNSFIATANTFFDTINSGIRYDSWGFFLVTYTGSVKMTYPVTVKDGKPKLSMHDGYYYYPYSPRFKLSAKFATADTETLGDDYAEWSPMFRAIEMPVAYMSWPMISERWQFSMSFVLVLRNKTAVNREPFTVTAEMFSGPASYESTTGAVNAPISPPYMLQASFEKSCLSMIEVNPAASYLGNASFVPNTGGPLVPASVPTQGSSGTVTPSNEPLMPATVLAEPTETLKNSFSGAVIVPVP